MPAATNPTRSTPVSAAAGSSLATAAGLTASAAAAAYHSPTVAAAAVATGNSLSHTPSLLSATQVNEIFEYSALPNTSYVTIIYIFGKGTP